MNSILKYTLSFQLDPENQGQTSRKPTEKRLPKKIDSFLTSLRSPWDAVQKTKRLSTFSKNWIGPLESSDWTCSCYLHWNIHCSIWKHLSSTETCLLTDWSTLNYTFSKTLMIWVYCTIAIATNTVWVLSQNNGNSRIVIGRWHKFEQTLEWQNQAVIFRQKTSKMRMNSSLIDYFGSTFNCCLFSCVFIETIKSSKRANTHTSNEQNAAYSVKSNKSNSGVSVCVCLLSLKIWFAWNSVVVNKCKSISCSCRKQAMFLLFLLLLLLLFRGSHTSRILDFIYYYKWP